VDILLTRNRMIKTTVTIKILYPESRYINMMRSCRVSYMQLVVNSNTDKVNKSSANMLTVGRLLHNCYYSDSFTIKLQNL